MINELQLMWGACLAVGIIECIAIALGADK